jgi:hypothetical protein
MSNHNQAMLAMLSLWNIADVTEREHLAASLFSEDVTYIDPHVSQEMAGAAGFLNVVKGLRTFAPDVSVEAKQPIQFYQLSGKQIGRIGFQVNRSGAKFSSGMFFVDFDADGLIKRVTGFVDPT